MRTPLTDIVIEEYKRGRPNLARAFFVGCGIERNNVLERNLKKIERLRRKIGVLKPHEAVSSKLTVSENLENIASYLQSLEIPKSNERDHRLQYALDMMLSDLHTQKAGSTLVLVAAFNLLAGSVGIDGVAAYESDGYYLARRKGSAEQNTGLSYPVRKVTPKILMGRMNSSKPIEDTDLVARLAMMTSKRCADAGMDAAAKRFMEYSGYFESLAKKP